MPSSQSQVCRSLAPFGTSIFSEMSQAARAHDAINLSQGFPDHDGPLSIRLQAAEELLKGPNQYEPSAGTPELRRAVARKMKRFYDLEVDPDTEVTVTAGATEALAATLLGLLNPGDEVILLEPFYDLYPAVVARAGARAVYVPLDAGDLSIPREAIQAAFSPRTRAILLNNPMNPCGKVFTPEELSFIGDLCVRFDALALADEVYEHIIYDGRPHHTILSVPGLRDRAVAISSTAKTFSMTGWKVGYTVAPPPLTEAVRAAHQFLTFTTPGPLQRAMAGAMDMEAHYYKELTQTYTRWRDGFCDALERLGLDILRPEGSYYCTLRIASLGWEDDVAFCHWLTREVGVAAIPYSAFATTEGLGGLVRLCFCKQDATLNAAITRLARWRGAPGELPFPGKQP